MARNALGVIGGCLICLMAAQDFARADAPMFGPQYMEYRSERRAPQYERERRATPPWRRIDTRSRSIRFVAPSQFAGQQFSPRDCLTCAALRRR
jgi:hypothetical protein